MEEDFFKVGYSGYLQKVKVENKKRTGILKKIFKHKVILWSLGIILTCVLMNFWLIYKFMSILYI